MSNRTQDFGMDVGISRRLNSKYDAESEQEAIDWINQLTGSNVPLGRENVQHHLKNGQILVKLINIIYERTPKLPDTCRHEKFPFRYNTMSAPFKQMENIQIFLQAAERYGVPRQSLFQTVDLFESRNMAQVLNSILQLGTECQRSGFTGPVCGARPTSTNYRQFSEEQLRMGEGIINLQSGTNKFASQSGISFGAVRHIADIRCDDLNDSGKGIIGLQMGTNKLASQKGMSFGAVRHIADIKSDSTCPEAASIINLQYGSNQGASQKGMVMGGVRHIADIKCDDSNKEAQSVISLQYGSNQGANQNGMRIGTQRHITDISCGIEPNKKTSNMVSLQMGPSMKEVANQSGMSFGAQRHINDSH